MTESAQNRFDIVRAVVYEDGRSNYVYSDNTSLILHPKGECFTYYASSGKKLRQLSKFAVNHMKDDKGSLT